LVALVAFVAIVLAVVIAADEGVEGQDALDAAPFGHVDRIDIDFAARSVLVQGWAIDRQTTEPIAVHVYVNGVLRAGGVADRSRTDVGAAYPSFGDRHGYAVSVPSRAGINVVCVYGINVGIGSNSLIGCRDVSVGGSNGLEGVMPGAMIVAHYGSGFDPRLGVLGTHEPFASASAVRERALQWTRFGLPVVPAFNYIASIATNGAGPDGDYSTPSDLATLRSWLDGIRSVGGIMVLDIQPGRTDFLSELRRYESLLLEPDVHVALDPEWRMGPGEVPGTIIGSVGVDEINATTQYLADLVRVHQLPRKIVVLHQFTPFMIRERERLATRNELHIAIQLDGFGSPEAKLAKYRELHAVAPFYSGFKLFLQQDTRLMDPAEVRALDPPPTWVSYQ
jgi:hypothetical protein